MRSKTGYSLKGRTMETKDTKYSFKVIDGDNIVTISKGNNKLGKLANFSLTPIESCPNSKHCQGTFEGKKFSCYALKAFRLYPNVRKVWSDNLDSCLDNLPLVRKTVSLFLAKHSPKIFRIHTAGDFFNQEYLDMWTTIARAYPATKFLAFTKAFHFDYNRPRNFKVIYSVMPETKLSDVPNGTRAYAGRRPITKKRLIECPGNCENCGVCWNLKTSENVFFPLH